VCCCLALQNKTIKPDAFISTLVKWSDGIEPAFASELKKLKELLSLPPEKAVTYISRAGIDAGYSFEDDWEGITPFVISSVLWSLYSFLRTPDNYWETICTAIIAGGDVDTTAAMAGAISGAYLGLDAIPSELAHRLTDQGKWGFDELAELANQCYEIKMQNIQ
jgi:hypothetical protein